MIYIHTVRKLKPGIFDEFARAFRPGGDEPRPGWIRFALLRCITGNTEVITFGVFNGTLDQMRSSQHREDYPERMDAIAPFVENVVSSGTYEVIIEANHPPDS